MSSANASGSSSLRPAWYKGAGGQGGRGFQPPPTVTSERGDKSRSSSWGSQERRDSNKFSALQDDEDGPPTQGAGNGGKPDGDKPNSRSEAFRTSFNRSSSTGTKSSGRSLADLAARVPDSSLGPRRHSGPYEARSAGGVGPGRFSSLRGGEPGMPSSSSGGTSIDAYKPDPKVIRFTREKLLSMRSPTNPADESLPPQLRPMEGSVVISKSPQDPVCWDTLDADEIWAVVARERRLSVGTPKVAPTGLRGLTEGTDDARRRATLQAPSSGRWQRGVALPPPDEGGRRKDRDAENPNELWDDPIGGATGAASDFSAFGAIPDDPSDPAAADQNVFDFDKMAEASRKLEEELHGSRLSDEVSEGEPTHAVRVDPKRPLASAGTTIASGSGDNVNVFEDFDSPSETESETPAIRAGDEDPTASSRLMKMIGVNKEPPENDGSVGEPKETTSNPWASDDLSNRSDRSSPAVDPIIGSIAGVSSSVPLNPWGDPIVPTNMTQQPNAGDGMGLAARLEVFAAEQNAREAQVAAQMEQRAQQEAEIRRRQEAQRRALAQRQAEERARQQHVQATAMQQRQQAATQQSQVELVLMERICAILENSWGRSDLVSILTTLHSEDSRVIPLLNNVDALRALIARSPQRVALRRDPNFAGDMAVLLMTNAQWQQQQQARAQQEELQRREQQRRMEEEAAVRALSEAQKRAAVSILPDAPWYYSDPQNNIQGPFRGEEMRQWLEAGYFKGDLPISQQISGPFHPLSALFPDLSVAFRTPENNSSREEAEAAEVEHRRRLEAEEERLAAQAAAQAEAEAREAEERERAEMERKAALESEPAAEKAKSANGGNESSAQLKMMLGLASGVKVSGDASPVNDEDTVRRSNSEKRSGKAGNKKSQQRPPDEGPAPTLADQPVPSSKPASTAWGGAAKAKPKKSMSEIQQEEARAAALVAMHRDNVPRQSSSGWANVAASGSTGWSSGTLKPTPAAAAANANVAAGPRSAGQPRTKTQQPSQTGATRKVAPVTQQQRSSSSASSTPAEEFGASMSPALENWCKDQMQKINGSDDLTLVAFCMTLDDANEVRQYLTTYLGSTPQVNAFATEFISKRGLGMNKQEEWETPGSAKKGRKKKSGSR